MLKNILKLTIVFISLYFLGAASKDNLYTNDNFIKADNPKKVEREFNVKSGQKVELDLKTGSSIKITGWDKGLLKVTATLTGEDVDKVELDFYENNNGVTITTGYDSHFHNMNTDGEIIIFAPYKFDVEFNTMGGTVELKNLEGKLEGKTMGGGIKLSELKGVIDVTTMGGEISITDSELDGNALTMGGDVMMKNIIGNISAKTMGGDVIQSNVKGKLSDEDDEVSFTSMGGDLSVDDAPNGCRLKTMGGDITINSVMKFAYAETMGGDIRVEKADGEVKVKTMGGDVSVKVIEQSDVNHDVDLTSLGGNIQLVVPGDFDMTVNIEIKYDEDRKRAKIISDFEIKEEIEDDSGAWSGRKTKILKGTAVFGSGKNKVTIRTVNGEVKLKKS